MNSWLLIRRLRGPAFIILVGITALLNQWGILRFSRSWPLYLILAGIFGLLERAVLASPVPPPYPGSYPGAYSAGAYGPAAGYSDPLAPPVVPPVAGDPRRRP